MLNYVWSNEVSFNRNLLEFKKKISINRNYVIYLNSNLKILSQLDCIFLPALQLSQIKFILNLESDNRFVAHPYQQVNTSL